MGSVTSVQVVGRETVHAHENTTDMGTFHPQRTVHVFPAAEICHAFCMVHAGRPSVGSPCYYLSFRRGYARWKHSHEGDRTFPNKDNLARFEG